MHKADKHLSIETFMRQKKGLFSIIFTLKVRLLDDYFLAHGLPSDPKSSPFKIWGRPKLTV